MTRLRLTKGSALLAGLLLVTVTKDPFIGLFYIPELQYNTMFTRAYALFSENSPLHVCEEDLGVSSTRAAKLSADDTQ